MIKLLIATFAGGCFWCMQPPFDQVPGVIKTTVGYTGGHVVSPNYDQVSSGATGHVEAVEIEYDPTKITYDDLLNRFWQNIDPTNAYGQFADIGPQYKTAIFYHSEEQKKLALASRARLEKTKKIKVATTIQPAQIFYPAEGYHQCYYQKNPVRYTLYKKGSGREAYIKKHQ
jgi:methionine-S-sulfoxide reductase